VIYTAKIRPGRKCTVITVCMESIEQWTDRVATL